jgi:hypothetical protein
VLEKSKNLSIRCDAFGTYWIKMRGSKTVAKFAPIGELGRENLDREER